MRKSIRIAFSGSAVVIAGIGLTGAAMQPSSHGNQAAVSRQSAAQSHRRTGGRFFAEYDLNHDGKITRDEFNTATAQRFAEAAGGSKAMNAQQFAAFRTRSLHQHADQSFRRADWNGDGKLSLDEFANPIRASFERADRQSSGVVPCRPNGNASGTTPANPHSGRRGARGSRGAANFCARDDLNHDGKVTRAELDKALAQQFAAASKGSGVLTHDQYLAMQNSRAHDTSGRAFRRLDQDGDGKLTLAEFLQNQQRTFSRMDRNGDSVITLDEVRSSRRSYSASRSQSRT